MLLMYAKVEIPSSARKYGTHSHSKRTICSIPPFFTHTVKAIRKLNFLMCRFNSDSNSEAYFSVLIPGIPYQSTIGKTFILRSPGFAVNQDRSVACCTHNNIGAVDHELRLAIEMALHE